MKAVVRVRQFVLELRAELDKVSWPTRQQLIESTMLVLMMTGLLGAFLWIWDFLASWLIGRLL